VVLQLMLLPLLLLLPLWDLRLPGLARAMLLVLVPVLVGTDMRLVVALLQVLVGD
jgi:predicted membrane protein